VHQGDDPDYCRQPEPAVVELMEELSAVEHCEGKSEKRNDK
jgi:hypothetical protein